MRVHLALASDPPRLPVGAAKRFGVLHMKIVYDPYSSHYSTLRTCHVAARVCATGAGQVEIELMVFLRPPTAALQLRSHAVAHPKSRRVSCHETVALGAW